MAKDTLYIISFTYLLIINVVGYVSMFIDKRRAIKNKWRISENMLLIIAALGGSVGSLLGMKVFRHKTKHVKFTLGVPAIIIMQILLTIYISFKM